ncbi:NAD-dependent epimerase/dehydratase family protein [Phytoactinopolyspora alkaliphila]|uniref:NAD-dependent epimerase/dehydratase family protein n=1 Tax=Phytoactinopolyspora alkaliphila TaxID=1783498 RepID=A0A6N9YHZ7_9ACTN|nr:NAD-dependent epimerase/dehydratase family protein [Phytoactinopolyspora alkaliphila]NED94565.1 NAD-dependent epimerase/dehydratase family protein [Phytoactinopolyspora alkaliphila]
MVVGVARYLGACLARVLADDPRVDRVVGVDVVPPPTELGGVEFIEADITTSAINRAIARSRPDVVVHMNILATRADAGGRVPQKEINVIGTMQLLAACQRSDSVRKLVVKSSTAVYGAGSRAPALFAEDMAQNVTARSGYEKDASEVESYVRGFSRRRPDVDVTILRLANVFGPVIRTVLSEYFVLPVVPVVFGRDPRFQLVHEDDCLDALRMATIQDHPGIFNIAGDGFLVLSQALRRAGRLPLPLPSLGHPVVRGLMRRAGIADMDSVQTRFLTYGRGVDTTRMHEVLGFKPRYGTVDAFDAFVEARARGGVLDRDRVDALDQVLRSFAGLAGAFGPGQKTADVAGDRHG